jgi:uncharacterized membrane protein
MEHAPRAARRADSQPTGRDAAARPLRRPYIDWLRGLAVVIMIEWHTLDSWTRPADKATDVFWYFMLVGGFAAPLFLFTAGLSVALACGSRVRRGETAWRAARPMVRRGVWVWVLALLFRVQAYVVSPGATLYGILKVDILNVMGPAIAAAALVWGAASRVAWRAAGLVAAAVMLALLTPPVRASTGLASLPDPIEWYFRPWPGRTTFTLFPWAGFVFAGAAAGVLLDRARSADVERRANLLLGAGGTVLGLAAFGLSYLPSPFAESRFWTSSPAFFFLRVGVLLAGLGLAYAWSLRPRAARFSPLRQFGQTSLFVYWIHVEMVYGFLSGPLHRALTLPRSLAAFLAFATLMFAASMLKTRLTGGRRAAAGPQPSTAAA